MQRPSTNILQGPVGGNWEGPPYRNPNSPPGIGDRPSAPDSEADYDIVMSIKSVWVHEDKIYAPIQKRSEQAYRLYNNTYDSDLSKDDWQSRMKLPYTFMTVERWTASLIQMLEQGSSWLETESVVPQLQMYHNLAKRLVLYILGHDKVKFMSVFREAVKTGLLSTMMHLMINYEQDGVPVRTAPLDGAENTFGIPSALSEFMQTSQDPQTQKAAKYPFIPNPLMPQLKLTLVPSSMIRLDSSGQNRYKIWKTRLSVADLRATASDRGYNVDAVEAAISRVMSPEEIQGRWRQRNETGLNSGTPEFSFQEVELTHFEGTLDNPLEMKRIFKRKYCVICNEQVLLQPTDSPFWDAESAIVSAPFIQQPNSPYGKSPIVESVDGFYMRHEFNNNLVDYLVRAMNPPYEVDEDVMSHSQSVENLVLYPGKRISINAQGNPNAHVIKPVAQPDLPSGTWQYMQYWQQQMSEITGMAQEIMGMPKQRQRTSGMESQARRAEAGNWLAFVFSDIEDQFLSKVLRLIYLRTLQFIPDEMWKAWVTSNIPVLLPDSEQIAPELKQKWVEELTKCASWTAQERFMFLGGYFKFKIRIFSSMAERQTEIEKGTFLLNVLSKFPQGLQELNLVQILIYIVRAFGWDTELVVNKSRLPVPDAQLGPEFSPDALLEKLKNGGAPQGEDLQPPSIEPTFLDTFSQMMQPPSQGMHPMQPMGPGGPSGPGAPSMPHPPDKNLGA